jgi:predicted transcriptional regulator
MEGQKQMTHAYPDAPGFKEEGTSNEAARKIEPRAGTLRELAYATISHSSAGLTADEVAARMGETVLAIRPRLTELKLAGRIVRTGQRRRNISGMNAAVWCCT